MNLQFPFFFVFVCVSFAFFCFYFIYLFFCALLIFLWRFLKGPESCTARHFASRVHIIWCLSRKSKKERKEGSWNALSCRVGSNPEYPLLLERRWAKFNGKVDPTRVGGSPSKARDKWGSPSSAVHQKMNKKCTFSSFCILSMLPNFFDVLMS